MNRSITARTTTRKTTPSACSRIAAREILGRPLPDGKGGQPLLSVFRHADGQAGVPVLHRRRTESIATRASGETFPVEITIEPVGSGAEQLLTAFIRDISERKRA